MRISKRALVTVLGAAIAVLTMAFAAGAVGAPGHGSKPSHASKPGHRSGFDRGSKFDHHGDRHGAPLITESLAPSQTTDPTLHGVAPGGAPWILKRGEVRLKRDGKLDLFVRGLVIPSLGTAGPVTTISASLYCGADSNTTAADTSQQVPISPEGNARIRDTSFSVPPTCLAPVILIHPNGVATTYIALDGWRL
jgi:hypothetical protein